MAEQADTDISYSKRQKEEVKPRQEAVVKGITPDQPAPIVERKPEPVPAVAFSAAEEGFFSKILNFFRAKPAAPVVVAAPVASGKSANNRDRGDRNGRGPRGRGRNNRDGRNRNEERTGAADAPKQAQPVAAEAQVQAPRQPRPPKEPREGGNQGNQGRRDRQQRNREERNEVSAESKSEEALLNTAAPAALVPPIAALTTPLATGDEAQSTPNAAPGEQGEDQPRRRRRRGGRNRNRRERGENGETIVETSEVAGEMDDEGLEEVTALTGSFKPTNVHPAEAPAEYIAHTTPAPVAISSLETHLNGAAPAITETAPVASSNLSNAIAAPVIPQEVARTHEPAPVAEVVAAEPVPVVAAPIVEPTPVAAAPVVATPAPAVAAPKPAPAAFVPARIAPAPMPLDELSTVLGAAGLTLATTNPEKLRAAQEAAAQIVAAPRVPRARKVLPPLPTEPLIQVETQQRQ